LNKFRATLQINDDDTKQVGESLKIVKSTFFTLYS